jgi:hypothetical protein
VVLVFTTIAYVNPHPEVGRRLYSSGTTLLAFHIVTSGNRIPAQWPSFQAVHFLAQVLAQVCIFPGKGITARFRNDRFGSSW